MSRVKSALMGAVLLMMTLVLFACGGSAAARGTQSLSRQHIVSVAPDINMIMATGACKPGSSGG